MLVIALLSSMFVAWKRGRELYFDEEELFDVIFAVLLVVFISSRLGYVLTRFDIYGFNILAWVNVIGKPGLLYEAGLLGGIAATIRYAKVKKWDVYSLGDVLVVSLSLMLLINSFGAFLNGSGYGVATDSFVGMNFPGLYEKRHPVQLYELFFYLIQFSFLWKLESVYRTLDWYRGSRSEAQTGFITSVFLISHGLIGIGASLLRQGLFWGWVRVDVVFYLVIVLVGSLIMLQRSGVSIIEGGGDMIKKFSRITAFSEKLSSRKRIKNRVKRDLSKGIF